MGLSLRLSNDLLSDGFCLCVSLLLSRCKNLITLALGRFLSQSLSLSFASDAICLLLCEPCFLFLAKLFQTFSLLSRSSGLFFCDPECLLPGLFVSLALRLLGG